jgi:hypothetical protein
MKKSTQLIRRFGLTVLTAGAVALLAACQTAPVNPVPQERSVLLQRMDAVIQGAQPGIGVRLVTKPDPVVTGQALSVEVGTSQAGYLYLYQVSTDGRILNVVFPNAVDGANYLQPGVTALPRASWQLKAQGPAGVGYIVAVLTQKPINLLSLQGEANQGLFNLPQPYGAATTPLREVAK